MRPSQVLGPKRLSKAPARPGCPSSEDLAAFIDGRLQGPERERIVEHLASCEDCYAVFTGVVDFQAEEGAGATSDGEDGEPQASADRASPGAVVVPFPERRRVPWYRPTSLAACLLAGVGGAFLLYRFLYTPPSLDTRDLFASIEDQAVSLSGDTWFKVMRSGEQPTPDFLAVPFMLGVYWTDLRIAAMGKDLEQVQNLARESLRILSPGGDADASLFAELDPSVLEILRRLADEPLAAPEILENLDEYEPRLDLYFEKEEIPEFGLGKWTAAGRFAALAKDTRFFRRFGAGRRYLGWLGREPEQLLEPSELKSLRAGFRAAAEGGTDYEDLAQRFADIILRYEEGLE